MRTLLHCLSAVLFLLPGMAAAAPLLDPPSMDGLTEEEDENDSDSEGSSDDALDDILNTPTEQTVKEELDAVKSGDIDDTVGANVSKLQLERGKKKRIIKTIQKKDFLKLGRFELTPNLAFVTNDPFLNRYIIGAGFAYHPTEIFAVELNVGFSPDLGEADWKPLTKQLVENNKVSPDLSPLSYFGNATFSFSPIYGKVAISSKKIIHFDIFGAFGMGAVRTGEDLVNLQTQDDPQALATQFQVHPTTNFGGGARIVFGESMALRLEGRSLVYIETVNSVTLEMKNNFILQGGISFFFPGMKS